MPLYEYECDACGQRFEKILKFSDPPLEVCAKCGKGPIHKLPSSPAIQFKGSGWYITDYAKSGSSGAPKNESSNSSETKSESKSESKPAETKSSESSSASTTTKSE